MSKIKYKSAREFFQYYRKEALKIFEEKLEIRLSLGQKMLLRRRMTEALEELEKNEVVPGSFGDFKLSEEGIARSLCLIFIFLLFMKFRKLL